MSDIQTLQKRALEVRKRYTQLNQKEGRSEWGPKDYAMGFAGDLGDLMKLVMAKENMRDTRDLDKKLKHELGDCLWSVLVLADYYGIDLEEAFQRTMDELDERIEGVLA